MLGRHPQLRLRQSVPAAVCEAHEPGAKSESTAQPKVVPFSFDTLLFLRASIWHTLVRCKGGT